ncbi:ABC transporter substrate-binding protein [Sporanaerobium hydrogeniformans]|uniref:ABC transporter substrate-binding protein n=1 Tax=Sporanaerobium hydrogeniformans TaxID=3072179 RepID=UPI0015D4B825|nr:extracellular solute-binding protein [Sporanaerobium hydrogeniformans]
MKLRKILTWGLASMLAATSLAGCGNSSSNADAKTPTGQESNAGGQQNTSGDAGSDVTTITYWGWDTNWYEPMIKAFEKDHPNIKIEVTNVAYSDYFTKIQQAIASGSELPTMVQQSCTLIANYKELGVFEDLTQAPYNVDPNKFFDFIKDRAMTEDGKLIGIEQSVSPSAIAYKRDLAKEYFGTDDPNELAKILSTPEDYIKYGKEVQEKSGGKTYLFHSGGAVAEWLYFADSTDLQNGKTLNFTKKMTPVMDLLVQMRDNKVVDTFENGTPQANATYAGDSHIFYPCPNWAITYYIKANDPDGSGNWGLMMPATGGYSHGGCSIGITNTSTDAEKAAAWEFMNWAFLTQDGVDVAKSEVEYYVPTKEFYEDASYASGEDPFFAGQDIGGFLYGEIAGSIQLPTPSIYDQTVIDIRDLLATAIMSDGSMTVEKAIEKGLEECQNRIMDDSIVIE